MPTHSLLARTHERLEIRLFGHASISYGGTPLKFAKRSTTTAMLAHVVLKRGQPISREALAYAIFPEHDEPAALSELRRYLYLANKALPSHASEPWLIVDAETVAWNERAGALVDVVEFERLSVDPETQASAIEVYGGDLLEDVYDDWVVGERERLRARYLEVLQQLLERHRSARDFQTAIGYAKRILATDAWREDTLRTLVTLRYESGDTAGALAEYERFAKRLRDDLAIAPMPETVAVRQSILRNETIPGSVEPPASPRGDVARSNVVLPFVGRARELAKLHAAWTRSARGTGTFALLGGEAGVGKTRLIAELARLVQSEGGRVFVGTTSAPESMPYQPLVEALRSAIPLLQARPVAAARRAALARLLPELRDSGASVETSESSAEREVARIHDALVAAVRSLASPRPALFVLEDLHWAGSATAEALGALVPEIARTPVLILGTCRDEETPPGHPLRALQRALALVAHVEETHVDRLLEADVCELVERVDGLRGRGPALASQLYAQSEGNALFLNEAISVNLEAPADGGRVPESVAALIAARVAALGDEARSVAEIAAVAGIGFTVSLVRDVSNAPAAAIARGVDELLDRRIFREAGARTTHDYVFSHHLIVASIYDGIEPAFREQRHGRIARYLETVHAEGDLALPREIAQHHERAGDNARASAWYVTAARAAANVYAYADAIDLATRAFAAAPNDGVRASALDIREQARARRGDREGQRNDIEALDSLAGDDVRAKFDVLGRGVLLARSLGDANEELRLIGALRNAAEALDDDDARTQVLVHAATHAKVCGHTAEAQKLALDALKSYEALGNDRGQFECLFLLVDITSNIGDMEASRHYLDAMRERATTLRNRSIEARALSTAATAELLRQEYRASFDLSRRGLAVYVAINDPEGEAYSRGRLAITAARLGEFDESQREFDLALKAYESIGNRRGLALVHTNRAVLLMRLGLLDDALHSIECANALLDVVQEQRSVVTNLVNASFINLHCGDAEKAKSLAATALDRARELRYPLFEAAALANLGNAERVLGAVTAAIQHMEAGMAMRRPIQEGRDFVDDLADLVLAYIAAGRLGDALAITEELLALRATEFSGAFWPQYIWWAIARGLDAAGAAEGAGKAMGRAREELVRFAQRIGDQRTRASFLALAVNRRIMEAEPAPPGG